MTADVEAMSLVSIPAVIDRRYRLKKHARPSRRLPLHSSLMRGKLILWARRAHLYLGVFFSPLLLLFLITGWWQTLASDDEKEREGGFLHELMKKFSNVHTSSEWPRPGTHHHTWLMKWYAVAMCIAMILLIALGLFLAWQVTKPKWRVVLAFVLGIAVPAVILYFA